MQRVGPGVLAPEPFPRLDPGRMWRAVVVAEGCDLFRIQLDLARRRPQLVLVRVGAEVAEQDVFLADRRDFQIAGLPERIEVRQRRSVGTSAVSAILVEVAEPGILVATLGVGLGDAEALRQSTEDVEIVARLPD